METDYLKRCFGTCLSQALAEVAKARPCDPIEYLAHWLYHYRKTCKAKEEDSREKIWLKEEYDHGLKETEMTEMLKQGEWQTQQKYEKCPQPLISVASSTMKTVLIQENTKPLEKDALKPESLPGTSNTIPGMPQIPSWETSGQADCSVEAPQEINSEAFQHDIAPRMHPGSKSP
uniref:DPY30 domain-containing protein 2 n=1 Tax=Suricata suricatta TaxID=37032 RepID=A0A673V3S3_SURSU